MRRRIPILLGVLAAVPLVALVAGYVATSGGAPVPRTVVDDPSLPSATVRGVKLHVLEYGDPARATVVVLHGGPGNDSRYLLPLAALSDEYHVVLYDQRGSGLSERVDDDRLRLEALYDELDGIVDRFGAGRPVAIVGHSWGAMLASGYSGRHPEKVFALVLAAPGMLTAEAARSFMAATNGMRPKASLGLVRAAAAAWLRSLHVRGPDRDARRDLLVGSLMQARVDDHPMAGYFCGRDPGTARMEGWRFGARAMSVLLGEAAARSWQIDFTQGVERVPGKVLFVAGGCDTIAGEEQQRLHMRRFRDAGLAVIEGAGHTMFGEKPEESIALVRRYLADARLFSAAAPALAGGRAR